MAVEQSMKLITMMREKGWITVSDNDIWGEVSANLTFNGPMRKHSSDATRLLSGNNASQPITNGSAHKKASVEKKPNTDSVAVLKKKLDDMATKLDADASSRAQWGSDRHDAAQRLGCDPAILVENGAIKPGRGFVLDGTWKIPMMNPMMNQMMNPMMNPMMNRTRH